MEFGDYVLQLYCDHALPIALLPNDKARRRSHGYSQFPNIYRAESRAVAVKRARDDGWVFHFSGKHSCPRCARARVIPITTYGDKV